RLGEAVLNVLREHERLALGDVEDAARALHELRVDALGLLDLGGQPDRVAFVASGRAVDDADAHHVLAVLAWDHSVAAATRLGPARRMELRADAHIPFPREVVFAAYR